MYRPDPELDLSIATFRDVEHAMSQAVSLHPDANVFPCSLARPWCVWTRVRVIALNTSFSCREKCTASSVPVAAEAVMIAAGHQIHRQCAHNDCVFTKWSLLGDLLLGDVATEAQVL